MRKKWRTTGPSADVRQTKNAASTTASIPAKTSRQRSIPPVIILISFFTTESPFHRSPILPLKIIYRPGVDLRKSARKNRVISMAAYKVQWPKTPVPYRQTPLYPCGSVCKAQFLVCLKGTLACCLLGTMILFRRICIETVAYTMIIWIIKKTFFSFFNGNIGKFL